MRFVAVLFFPFTALLLTGIGCSSGDDALNPGEPPVADGPCSDDTRNRFVDCGNGTVTDTATGLLWLKDSPPGPGWQTWDDAMTTAAGLGSGMGSLTDHSSAGSWRLPTLAEWYTIVKSSCYPALPDRLGTGCYTDGPWASDGLRFGGRYWSSDTSGLPTYAWFVDLDGGHQIADTTTSFHQVWPVRGGP